jgi:hypothetical protein
MRGIKLILLSVLGACGSSGGGSTDIEPTLRFADRSDAEISRLVAASQGSEGFQAQAQVGAFDNSFDTNPDPCPAIAISGHTVTITGDCTTRDNVRIEGSASVTNPLGWGSGETEIEYDYGADTVYELDGLAYVYTSGMRQAYDGVFRTGSSFTKMDMDVTAEIAGVGVRSDIYISCSQSGTCNVNGSGVELVDVGGARVSGSIVVRGSTASASFTLKGEDTVKVTMQNNCVSWTLEGTDRKLDPCTR